jgi:hypothetical protein
MAAAKRTYVVSDNKNRNIRLTDHQWQVFREKLGVQWLKERIAEADPETATPTK